MKAHKKQARRAAAAVERTVPMPVPIAPAGPRPWHYAAGLLAAIICAFQAFGPALHGPFLFDDLNLPFAKPNAASFPMSVWIGGVRPLLMASYLFNFDMSGYQTYGYHVLNVLLHVVNGVFVFLIARKILEFVHTGKELREILAAFAAVLFLLHPVQTEAVAYIAGRSEVFSVLFLLAAFCVFLYRRKREASTAIAIAVFLLFFAALASKEHTIVLAPLLLLTDYFFNPGFSVEGIRRNWRIYVPILAGAALGVVYVLTRVLKDTSAGFHNKEFTPLQYFFTECRAFFVYLRLFLFPAGQNIDYDYPRSANILDHGALFALLAIAALVALAIVYRRKFPLASYGLLVTLLLFAPTSSFVPIRDALADRRMYLPFIGMLFIALEFLRRVRMERRALALALALVCAVFAVATYQRSKVFASTVALWQDAAAKSPQKQRVRMALGNAYYRANRCKEALREYDQTANLGPPSFGLWWNSAEAYDCVNQPDKALEKLDQARSLQNNAKVLAFMAMEQAKQGKAAEALKTLDSAEKLDPTYTQIYLYRGGIHSALSQMETAAADFRRALEIEPGNLSAQQSLAALQK